MRKAALKPIVGADRVARFMLGLVKQAPAGTVPSFVTLNGRPAMLVLVDGEPYVAMAFHIENGKIMRIYNQVNPHKIEQLSR